MMGHKVYILDGFRMGGSDKNYQQWKYNSNFKLIRENVNSPNFLDSLKVLGNKVDLIFHFASYTQYNYYTANLLETIDTIYQGTKNIL